MDPKTAKIFADQAKQVFTQKLLKNKATSNINSMEANVIANRMYAKFIAESLADENKKQQKVIHQQEKAKRRQQRKEAKKQEEAKNAMAKKEVMDAFNRATTTNQCDSVVNRITVSKPTVPLMYQPFCNGAYYTLGGACPPMISGAINGCGPMYTLGGIDPRTMPWSISF